MARKYWLPGSLAERAAMFQNIKGKIGGYTAVLPLTAAQETRIVLICNIFNAIYTYVEAMRATTSSLIEWRDEILTGVPTGTAAPAAPAYSAIALPAGSFRGIMTEFKDLRELIVALPGYNDAIGEDLMIVGDEITPPNAPTLTPDLKVSVAPGYKVNIAGSLQSMDAMRIEYQRNGTNTWPPVGFFTKMPGEITITPATPGQPEAGRVRAIFVQKNADVGNYSPEYPVTVS